jgi:hypothetical protein
MSKKQHRREPPEPPKLTPAEIALDRARTRVETCRANLQIAERVLAATLQAWKDEQGAR